MKVNQARILEVNESEENIGFCLACGHEQECVEPDAAHYTCEVCGEPKVFGREEVMLFIY